MAKPLGAFSVKRRSKTNRAFVVSVNSASGLPLEVCAKWQRRSFSCLPPGLSEFRNPKSRAAAEMGAMALIDLLRDDLSLANSGRRNAPLPTGKWLARFTSLENNPRAERLVSGGLPYSPGTIDMYRIYFNRYISDDPFLGMDINAVDVPTTRAFIARIGMKRTKDGRELAGTRTFEITVNFVRMAFREYWEDHQGWANPFDRIKPPKRIAGRRRDVLQESEILGLFMPGVITDPLERAVAVAMFWAGLRRSEIFALKTADLDWRTPKLNINRAWKRFGSAKKRTLGDPKWHKLREAPFPEELQSAIKALQEARGIHEFVFCKKDGSIPHGKWILDRLPVWMEKAGIDTAGRRIVPHSARHSLASCLESAGVPLRYIRDMLGHTSMKTTVGYLHTPEGKINEIMRKIGDIAGGEKAGSAAGEGGEGKNLGFKAS